MRPTVLLSVTGFLLLDCYAGAKPDCKDYPPVCVGNVGVNCSVQKPCDFCDWKQSFPENKCDEHTAASGVPKTCRVTQGTPKAQPTAICVDSALIGCAGHAVDETWCTPDGNFERCYGTVDGPFVSTTLRYAGCAQDASRD